MKPRLLSVARLSFPLASALAALTAPSALAASGNWNVDSLGNWSLNTNWSSNPTVPGTAAGDIIGLNNNISLARTVTIDTTSRTAGILNIGDSNNTHGFTLAASGGASLTLNNSGSGAQINETGSIVDTISTGITLADNLTINAAGSLTISGLIGQSGTRSIIKDGAGTLLLSNDLNSFSGGLTIRNGTVNVGATGGAVGTGALTMGGSGSGGALLIGNATITRALTVNAPTSGSVILAANTSGNSLTYQGNITLNGDLTVRSFSGGSAGTGNTTVSGTVTGTGNLLLSNTGAVTAAATSKIVVSNTVNHVGTITARGDNAGTTALNTISGNIGTNVTSLTKEGIVKLVLSGTNTFTGGVNISAGTLELGSAGALNGQNAVAFTSGSTGTLALNGNNVTIRNLSTHATPGTTFVQNGHASTATTLTVGNAQNLSGTYAGTIRNGAVGTLALTKAGTGTLTLSGLSSTAANNYSGNTTIGQGTLAITHAATANLTGGLIFGASSGSTNTGILDLTNGSASFASLLVQTNTASSNTLTIGSGETLTINGNVTVGANIANAVASLVTTGGGDLVVGNGGNNTFIVGGASGATLGGTTAVDLSSLASFTVDYGSGGTFRLGDANTGSNTPAPSTLKLATDNTITVGNFRIGDFSGGQATHVLTLGTGANTINATTVNIGSAGSGIRSGGSMVFDPADTTGTLTLNGFGGVGTRTILNMVNSTGNTAAGMTSIVDLSGHTADIMASTMTMASRSGTGTGSYGTATFTFDQGTLDVTTLVMSRRAGGAAIAGNTTATMNLGDSAALGVPTVTIGNITMAAATAGAAGSTATADLNITGGNVTIGSGSGTAINLANAAAGLVATSSLDITGGTVTVTGDIIRTVGGGTETATITLDGGSLDMGGNAIGTLAGAITLTAESGTLQNVASINGSGGLTKTSTGTLLLQGTNGYSGVTAINAGTLQLQGGSAILDAGAVVVADDATAKLQLLSNETIGSLAGGGSTGGEVALGSNHLTAGDAGNTTFAGTISGGLSSKFTKKGTGTMTLSGTNAYDDTRVSLGTLLVTKAAALPAYNLDDRIDVDSGATLAVRAGGAGEWIAGELDSLLATNSFTSGSNLGVDVSVGNTFTYAGDIGTTQTAKGLVKSGDGKLELTGTNTYTGATVVQGGTLAINGANVSTSINVSGTGSTLQGNGSTTAAVTIGSGGTLASGNSIESLATGDLTFTTGSNFQYELDKDAAAIAAGDLTAVTGDLSLTGTVTLSLIETGSGTWELGSPLGDAINGSPNADKLTLISYTGGWNGGLFTYLGNLVLDDSSLLLNGQLWWFNYNDTDAGTNFTGDLTGTNFVTMTVPEPDFAALLGGLAVVGLLRRRRD